MGKFLPKIADWRSLSGAVALLLVGIHLSVISGLYFTMGQKAFGLMRTGWWWELALNFQIIAYFLMYICHSERLQNYQGWRRVRGWYRLLLALAGLSTPSILLVVAAQLNWFNTPPDIETITYYSIVFFSCWFIAAYILPLFSSLLMKGKSLVYFSVSNKTGGTALYFMPLIIMFFIFIIEDSRGGYLHLVLWPVFTYFQGAIVYIDSAFSKRTKRQADPFEYVESSFKD